MNYPKVLVLTRNAWNDNSSTGNTLSNFFRSWPSEKIASAFFRAEEINNSICQEYYRITEQELFRSLYSKAKVGTAIQGRHFNVSQTACSSDNSRDEHASRRIYSFFSKYRLTVGLWCRELLWKVANWRTKEFDAFLEKVAPDVLYMPLYDSPYMHRVMLYVKQKTGARVCLFTGDDTYTFHKRSFSPLFWLNLLMVRRSSRKLVQIADTLFVISDKQKEEYDKIFKRDCILLRKGRDFSGVCTPKATIGTPIKLVYTGNIQAGRWKTLVHLAKSISEVNGKEQKFSLVIYSLTPKSPEMLKAFGRYSNAVQLMPPASAQEIEAALSDADILVYVDPFEINEKLKWRLSFSTKIVDYLASSRAILAIGPQDVAGMSYLQNNDAALCVNDVRQLPDVLTTIAKSPEMLKEYAHKAWNCGARNNRAEDVQATLLCGLQKAPASQMNVSRGQGGVEA